MFELFATFWKISGRSERLNGRCSGRTKVVNEGDDFFAAVELRKPRFLLFVVAVFDGMLFN